MKPRTGNRYSNKYYKEKYCIIPARFAYSITYKKVKSQKSPILFVVTN